MKAESVYPIEALKGSIAKEYYCRMLKGKLVIQHKPKRDKPPTEKQIAARKRFADKQRQRHEDSMIGVSGNVVVS